MWGDLPSYPSLGIEQGSLLAELEVEDVLTCAVVGHSAQKVASLHFLALVNDDGREVAIDRDVTAVTHEHVLHTAKGENSRNFAVEDGSCTRSRTTYIVCAFVVEHNVGVA